MENCLLEIRDHHDFETHLNFKRDMTGSLDRTSGIISSRRRLQIVSDNSVLSDSPVDSYITGKNARKWF